MKRKWFDAIYLIVFNYGVIFHLMIPTLYFLTSFILDKWASKMTHYSMDYYYFFESNYNIIWHVFIMPFTLIIGYFFYKDLRPHRVFLFYTLYLFGTIAAFAIFFSLLFYFQMPLMEKFIRFDNYYNQFKENPVKIFLMIMYHVILCSIFTIKYYHFLIKKLNKVNISSSRAIKT